MATAGAGGTVPAPVVGEGSVMPGAGGMLGGSGGTGAEATEEAGEEAAGRVLRATGRTKRENAMSTRRPRVVTPQNAAKNQSNP